MTTPAKLYGKDLSEYDEVDVDALLAQLSPEEINILAKEVDPDDNFLPPNQRCSYECKKDPTGPLDRKKLIEHINKEALETPDLPEIEPFVKGTVRGKKWVPPPRDDRELAAEEQIAIDMGEEYEHALSDATQEEIIDLAAILGFHSMMNQDQYHASLLNKGQPIGMGWDGITKSTAQKLYPMDPPNTTDIDESIKRVKDDDPKLIELNLNNIKNISDEKYEQLFAALPENEHLEVLSLTNVGLTDKTALLLAEAIEKSKTLRVLNVETNFISPPVIVTLVKSLLKARTIEEFRASNQRSTVLGNKIEMEITDLVEKNTSLLRLGLHLEFNDARHRVAAHLQRNIDRNEHELRKGNSLSPIPKSTSPISRGNDLLSMQKAKSPKPVHQQNVLTQQERVESKSLVGQKRDDRAKGEISLPVPQTVRAKSPLKEATSSTKEIVSPIKKEEAPKIVEKKPDTKVVEETRAVSPKLIVAEKSVRAKSPLKVATSPTKEIVSPIKKEEAPKIVAVDEKKPDTKVVEETRAVSPKLIVAEKSVRDKSPLKEATSPIKEIDSPIKNEEAPKIIAVDEKKPDTRVVEETRAVSPKLIAAEKSPPKEAKFPVRERISPVKAKDKKSEIRTFKVPPTPYPSLDEPKGENLPIDISQVAELIEADVKLLGEKKISPTRNPMIGELRHSSLSRAIDIDSLEQNGKDTNLEILAKKPEIEEKAEVNPTMRTLSPEALGRDERSVSPSQLLADKMTLLQAKIANFAEVADEKIASLRSRIDDYAREPLTLATDSPPESKKIQKPAKTMPVLELENVTEHTDVEPKTLPPKPPSKNVPSVKAPTFDKPTEAVVDSKAVKEEPIEGARSVPEPSSIQIAEPVAEELQQEKIGKKDEMPKVLPKLEAPELVKVIQEKGETISEKEEEKIVENAVQESLAPEQPTLKVEEPAMERIVDQSVDTKTLEQPKKPSVPEATKAISPVKEKIAEKAAELEKPPLEEIREQVVVQTSVPNVLEPDKPTLDQIKEAIVDQIVTPKTVSPLREATEIEKLVEPVVELGAVIKTPELDKPNSEQVKELELIKEPIEEIANPKTITPSKAKTPEPPVETSFFETPNIQKIAEDIENPHKEENPMPKVIDSPKEPEILEPPKPPEPTKAELRALALSQLTLKKGETFNVKPIEKTEAGTQSLPKPSPLLHLSVKKGDLQKIDPVKTTEASTQSIPKPNPMSLLAIKKGEKVTINPVQKSEVSTQFALETPQAEAASQTIAEEPIKTLEDSTQTPLVFSSLDHDYIFPGLRRVPYLPRPKSINIGDGDRVVVKPSSKPINEVLMLLYPVLHDYSKTKESKTFGLEEDIIKPAEADSTIRDLETTMQTATELSKSILAAPPKPPEEPKKTEEVVTPSVRTEIEIPLMEETIKPPSVAAEARFETKFTAVEKVSAISRTTIESEEHVKFIDKAYKSIEEVSTSERDKGTTTSIKSANMWQSLSSNLIKASEQTLLDLSKMGSGPPTNRTKTKIGKVSVYSSIEDLSRSKISDRHLGTLIKTVETTSVYSSLEDIPYTKYSERYKEGKGVVSTASVYSSTEDLAQYASSKYTHDLAKPRPKSPIYSSSEDVPDASSYSKYSKRYSDLPKPVEKPREKLSLLPRSKFSDRYKDDHSRLVETHQLPQIDKSYYKSATLVDHSTSSSRSQYRSAEELIHSSHDAYKYQDASLQASSIQSSISRNQSALRPYTYVPSSTHSHLSIEHVRARPSSPSTHTTTLQFNISPSGISELPITSRTSKYSKQDISDKPTIKISRVRDDPRNFRAISPIEKRSRPSKNLLSPYQQVSDPIDDDDDDELTIEESSQPTLDILSSASTADVDADANDDNDNSTTPKKRLNIMDTIKMLKNRVRDVITTEDRFTETHRLPTSSSNTSSSSFLTRRGSRTSAGVRSKFRHNKN